MKSWLLKAGLISCLTASLMHMNSASAAESTDIQTKCRSLGTIAPGVNPSFQHMNCIITNAAIEQGIPPEVAKTVAFKENHYWKHFNPDGTPIISHDNGIGLMQITNHPEFDQDRLKYDVIYNVESGLSLLSDLYDTKRLPAILPKDRSVIESWYFAIMAYNGIKPKNSPVVQDTGEVNDKAYQEGVYRLLTEKNFLNDSSMARIAFTPADFNYDPTSNQNIEFITKSFKTAKRLHASRYMFTKGQHVIVDWDNSKSSTKEVNLRKKISTADGSIKLPKGKELIITGNFLYSSTSDTEKQYVWYPVTTTDNKVKGYISSVYITEKLNKPSIRSVDDNDKLISGKAPKNTKVTVKKGSTTLASGTADSQGGYSLPISVQKAGTSLTVTYKDFLNTTSPAATLKVLDKTAPSAPKVSVVTTKTKTITGKAEAYSSISVKKGKTLLVKTVTDKYGKYKATIKPQKSGTLLAVTAADKAGNKSKAANTTVKK